LKNHNSVKIWQNIIVKPLEYRRKVKLLHVKQSARWNKKLCFLQRPTLLAKFQSLKSQICLFWGHLGNCLAKSGKNRINPNKCDICTLDIMVDFHWKNEANRLRSEICLIRSYGTPAIPCLIWTFERSTCFSFFVKS